MSNTFAFLTGAPYTLCRLPLLIFLYYIFILVYFIIHIILCVGIMLERLGDEGQVGERWEKKAEE